MTHSGSPSAVVKEKDSLGISSHAQCVQIDFKGARDVGRRLGRRLRVTCAWSPPRPASRHQPTGLGPSPESRWISCCKLNMKPGDTWLCAERLSGSWAPRELVRALTCIRADFVGKERLVLSFAGGTEVLWENAVRGLNAVPSHVRVVPVARPLASPGRSSGLPRWYLMSCGSTACQQMYVYGLTTNASQWGCLETLFFPLRLSRL